MRIARAADAVTLAALMVRVPEVFASHLEPHFQEEEFGLLPALAAVGEAVLVTRTLAEHTAMRNLIRAIRSGDLASLKLFGEQLAAHVHFEERELFATAQDVLSADYLNQAR